MIYAVSPHAGIFVDENLLRGHWLGCGTRFAVEVLSSETKEALLTSTRLALAAAICSRESLFPILDGGCRFGCWLVP